MRRRAWESEGVFLFTINTKVAPPPPPPLPLSAAFPLPSPLVAFCKPRTFSNALPLPERRNSTEAVLPSAPLLTLRAASFNF